MFMKKDKKGAFSAMSGMAIALVGFAIIISVGLLVVAETQDQVVQSQDINESSSATWTHAYNATRVVEEETGGLSNWIGILVIVGVGVLVFAMIRGFGGRVN